MADHTNHTVKLMFKNRRHLWLKPKQRMENHLGENWVKQTLVFLRNVVNGYAASNSHVRIHSG